MSADSPSVLVPIPITDAMLISSTVAEPDAAAGEVAWVSAGTYAVGDERIRATTHQVYECVQAHTGRTALPEADGKYWLAKRPTNRWALFDGSITTPTSIVTPLTVVLRPGFFNGLDLYGLDGAAISVTVKDGPGGATVFTYTGDLQEPPIDEYDWAFGRIKPLTKLLLSGILPYPDPEVTVTISAATGVTVKAGMLLVGDRRDLLDTAAWGGVEYGASVDVRSSSYPQKVDANTTKFSDAPAGTDMSVRIVMPRDVADSVIASLQEVLNVPASWSATRTPGYAGLSVYGKATSSPVSYDSFGHATCNLKVTGLF